MERGRQEIVYLMGGSILDRMAYRLLLQKQLRIEVTVDSAFSPTAVWDALRCKPSLVLVDADSARMEVLDAVQMVPRLCPGASILIISATVEPSLVQSWSSCKIDGYVVKDGGIQELRLAIEAISEGREYFSAGVKQNIIAATTNGKLKLSRREAELLPLIARGLTLRDAAKKMAVSYKTAESYRTSLLRKIGVKDRVELARYAIRERIVDP